MKNLAIILSACLMMSSCSFYTYQFQTGSAAQTETKPESIKIYANDINEEYMVIGSVAADVIGDGDAVLGYLKKKAAKLGADAIIKVELTKISSFHIRTGISGVAVKLK